MTRPAIAADHVSKYYAVRTPDRSNVSARFDPARGFAALKDVSLSLPAGTATGLVGRNGAGKTTMLRVLAGITTPTEGVVALDGRTATLMSLRVGMNARLSGRDNVYLYAALMGFDRESVESRLPEIVSFAELHDFIDAPFGSYSPGMCARLAFSTAVHLDADILLIDEILAVGDASFQERASARMRERFSGGRSVVLSSHNLAAIRDLCSHVIWFDQGEVRLQGPTEDVLPEYQRFCQIDRPNARPKERRQAETLATFDREGRPCRRFVSGDTIVATYRYEPRNETDDEHVRVSILDPTLGQTVYRLNSDNGRRGLANVELRCVFEKLSLPPRQYWLEVTRHGSEPGELLARATFVVFDPDERKASSPPVATGRMELARIAGEGAQ